MDMRQTDKTLAQPATDPHTQSDQTGGTLRGARARWGDFVQKVSKVRPEDSDDIRLQKRLSVGGEILETPAGLIWGLVYWAAGEPVAALVPLSFPVLTLLNLAAYQVTGRFTVFRNIQILQTLLLPFFLMVALGGFVNSGAVVMWSLTAPMSALVTASRREVVGWFIGFLALLGISGLLEPFAPAGNNLPDWLIIVSFVMNIVGPSLIAMALLLYFVGQKDTALELLRKEQKKSEELLLNVLPAEIAAVLKEGRPAPAQQFDSVCVLFADMVSSTPLASRLPPQEMVNVLNEVFSTFDALVDRHGLEKMGTSGDSYMVAAGVPRPRSDHAHEMARLALEMNAFLNGRPVDERPRPEFRIGMNCGPVVGGVIGQKKFHYDIWGDAVNIASRMESHGVPGKVHITRDLYELLKEDFISTPRGVIDVKGKGPMETWFLEGERARKDCG